METVGFNRLRCSDSGRMGCLNARSLRNFEGDASSIHVRIVGHDDARILIGSTTQFSSNKANSSAVGGDLGSKKEGLGEATCDLIPLKES